MNELMREESTGRYREEVIEGIIGELEKQNIAAKLAEKDFCADYMESIGKILDVYR